MSEALPSKYEKKERSRSRASRLLGRAAASLAGGAMLAAPVAITGALKNAEIHDDVGSIPATVSLSPEHSSVDFGVFGSLYDQSLTENGVGLQVDIDGIPDMQDSLQSEDPQQLVEPFTALYENPEATTDGYKVAMKNELKQEFITRQIETTAVLSSLGFLVSSMGGRISPRDRRRYLTATFGSAAALSMLASHQTYSEWQGDNAYPENTYAITATESIGGGQLEADNQLLATVINKAAPAIKNQRERNKEEVSKFVETAKERIDTELANEKFIVPQEGETLVLALSDIHSNQAMIETYQYLVDSANDKYGEGTLDLTLLVGDQTYGSASEISAIDGISEISQDVYGISGNHDSQTIEKRSTDKGINLLNGKTRTTDDGIEVLGAPDPALTKLSDTLTIGKKSHSLRSQDVRGQKQLGKMLDTEAQETNPAFVLSHEAYSLNKLIDKDDISTKSMTKWFNKDGDATNSDVPAGSVLYGHWHREFDYRIVRDAEGNGSVVAEMGTAGGAPSKISMSNLSFPWTTPTQQASAVVFRVDTERQLITGLQEINTSTGGKVTIQEAETVDQPEK